MFNHTLHACWNFSHHLVWLLLLDAECHIDIAQPSSDHQGAVKHGDNYGDPPECWRDCRLISLSKSTFNQIQYCCKFYLNINAFVNSYLHNSIRICHLLHHDKLCHCNISTLSFRQVPLGHYPEKRFDEPELTQVIQEFQAKLSKLGEEIAKRNEQLEVPYVYLHPSTIENSVSIWESHRDQFCVINQLYFILGGVFVVGRCCMMWLNILVVMWACGVVVQQQPNWWT